MSCECFVCSVLWSCMQCVVVLCAVCCCVVFCACQYCSNDFWDKGIYVRCWRCIHEKRSESQTREPWMFACCEQLLFSCHLRILCHWLNSLSLNSVSQSSFNFHWFRVINFMTWDYRHGITIFRKWTYWTSLNSLLAWHLD